MSFANNVRVLPVSKWTWALWTWLIAVNVQRPSSSWVSMRGLSIDHNRMFSQRTEKRVVYLEKRPKCADCKCPTCIQSHKDLSDLLTTTDVFSTHREEKRVVIWIYVSSVLAANAQYASSPTGQSERSLHHNRCFLNKAKKGVQSCLSG
jgi:hypothetical protein